MNRNSGLDTTGLILDIYQTNSEVPPFYRFAGQGRHPHYDCFSLDIRIQYAVAIFPEQPI